MIGKSEQQLTKEKVHLFKVDATAASYLSAKFDLYLILRSLLPSLAAQIKYEIGICKFSETAKGAMLGLHGADAGMLKLLFDPATHRLLGGVFRASAC